MSFIYYYSSILSDEERKEMKLLIFMEAYRPPSLDVEEDDSPPTRLICGKESIRGVFCIDPVPGKYALFKAIKRELRDYACKHVQLSGLPVHDPYEVNYIVIECPLELAQRAQQIKNCHKQWLYVHLQADYKIDSPKITQIIPKLIPLVLPPRKPDMTPSQRIMQWRYEVKKGQGLVDNPPSESSSVSLTEQLLQHVNPDPISRRMASWRQHIVSSRAADEGVLQRYASHRNILFQSTTKLAPSKPARAQSVHCMLGKCGGV